MRRREFIALAGKVAVAWPLAARAQQGPVPVIGFLGGNSLSTTASFVAALHQGLKEGGYAEGRNLSVEYRWAEGHFERLPGLAAELVSRKVAVLFAGGPPAAIAAKAATSSVPVVFTSGDDPVKLGLVASLARPGGNLTGVSILIRELQAKRLQLLHELVPAARTAGLIYHPSESRESREDAEAAAAGIGLRIRPIPITAEGDLEAAFAGLSGQGVDAVILSAYPAFLIWSARIIGLAARASMPVMYYAGGDIADGGLIGYGASIPEAYRLAGLYVARVLKGESPSDLPVVQPTKFILAVNLKTAAALGLAVPLSIIARADEVIE